MGDRPENSFQVRRSKNKVCKKDLCWFVRIVLRYYKVTRCKRAQPRKGGMLHIPGVAILILPTINRLYQYTSEPTSAPRRSRSLAPPGLGCQRERHEENVRQALCVHRVATCIVRPQQATPAATIGSYRNLERLKPTGRTGWTHCWN